MAEIRVEDGVELADMQADFHAELEDQLSGVSLGSMGPPEAFPWNDRMVRMLEDVANDAVWDVGVVIDGGRRVEIWSTNMLAPVGEYD